MSCLPCKQDYDRDYYAATSDIRARQKQQRKVVIKERNRHFVLEHLSRARGCADCGFCSAVRLDEGDLACRRDPLRRTGCGVVVARLLWEQEADVRFIPSRLMAL
jgi:hypothetical protein